MVFKRGLLGLGLMVGLFTHSAHAEVKPYLDVGVTFGGDSLITVVSGSGTESIKAGELLYFSGGAIIPFMNPNLSVQLGFGFAFDNETYTNGDMSFSRFPLTAIFFKQSGKFRVGGGATYHMDPTVECNIFPICSGEVELDDELGFVLQADMLVGEGKTTQSMLGLRYTNIDYDSIDGSNFGIFLTLSF